MNIYIYSAYVTAYLLLFQLRCTGCTTNTYLNIMQHIDVRGRLFRFFFIPARPLFVIATMVSLRILRKHYMNSLTLGTIQILSTPILMVIGYILFGGFLYSAFMWYHSL